MTEQEKQAILRVKPRILRRLSYKLPPNVVAVALSVSANYIEWLEKTLDERDREV